VKPAPKKRRRRRKKPTDGAPNSSGQPSKDQGAGVPAPAQDAA
jgi:hypothetical protein